MNTIKSFIFAMFVAVCSSFMLTSCDRDVDEASNLDGQWRGNFCMSYTNRMGYTYPAEYTILEFYQMGFSNHGTGKQIDYYSGYHCPIRYEYFDFDWSVNNGVLRMRYPYNHSLDIDIYDYDMTSHVFTGRIGSSNMIFTMNKYKDFKWGTYSGGYYCERTEFYNTYY